MIFWFSWKAFGGIQNRSLRGKYKAILKRATSLSTFVLSNSTCSPEQVKYHLRPFTVKKLHYGRLTLIFKKTPTLNSHAGNL